MEKFSKGSPQQFLHLVQNKIAELGGQVEGCDKITASQEATYVDDNGIMGEPGATWTIRDLGTYWYNNYQDDPSMSNYDSFDSWLDDTISQMTEMEDEFDDLSSICDRYLDSEIPSLMNELKGAGLYDLSDRKLEDLADACRRFYAVLEDTLGATMSINSSTRGKRRTVVADSVKCASTVPFDSTDRYDEVATKTVPDTDGFNTDYTMYLDKATGKYVFTFGDKEYYNPYTIDNDWECETESEAWEWFDDYMGEMPPEEEYYAMMGYPTL